MKEIKALTGIRGVAALYVVIFHYFLSSETPHLYNKVINHGYLAVDLFFILSGFLLTMTSYALFSEKVLWSDYKKFIYKRFARIYPLFFIIITIVALLVVHRSLQDYVVSTALLSILNGKHSIMITIWSLSAEWITYFFLPFVWWLIGGLKIKPFLGGSVFLVAAAILIYLMMQNENHSIGQTDGINGLLRCWADYFLGLSVFFVYCHSAWWFKVSSKSWVTILVFVCILVSLLFSKLDPAIIIAFAVIVLLICNETNILSKALSVRPIYWLGQVSYSVYLIHYVFILGRESFLRFLPHYIYSQSLQSILCIFVSLILSHYSFQYIELPVNKWLRNKWKMG